MTDKKQFHVMMKNLFTSSSGSDSISCGIPRCSSGEERKNDTMDSRGVIVSGGVGWGGQQTTKLGIKMEQQKQQSASEKVYGINT